jgi:Bacterial Ig-like domain (group 1)
VSHSDTFVPPEQDDYMRTSQRLFGMLICAALTACGSDLTLPGDSSPARLQAIGGDGQEATVGSRLSNPLIVQLTDGNNNPVSDVAVEFGFEGSTDAELESASEITDAQGRASTEVRLGSQTGPLDVAARVVQTPALKATFTVTALERDKGKKDRGKDKHDKDDEDTDDD